MSTGLLSTAITGLQAAQLGLLTTEHNITNANTAGYNRQRTVQATNVPLMTGAGAVGQGTHVQTIERMYNQYLVAQVNSAQTGASEMEAYYAEISQIDTMLADSSAGLTPALNDFFSGVQSAASNPSLLSSRQSMVSAAQVLANRFHSMDQRLSQIKSEVNGKISDAVDKINTYASQIGELNQRIILSESAYGQSANDLLDTRDQLIAGLNKLIKVETTTNTDGSFNVFIGNGQQLVVGTQVMTMQASASFNDPTRTAVGFSSSGVFQELPESIITGGELGGLVSFRSSALDVAQGELGRIATSLALTFNSQHSLGQDLSGLSNGQTGFQSNFFTIASPAVNRDTRNTGAGTPTATFVQPFDPNDYVISVSGGVASLYRKSDGTTTTPVPTNSSGQPLINGQPVSVSPSLLTTPGKYEVSSVANTSSFSTGLAGSDYEIRISGVAPASINITRLSDKATITPVNMGTSGGVTTFRFDGVDLAIDPAQVAVGDIFKLQPTRDVAGTIGLNSTITSDVRKIALAAPVTTTSVSTNKGSMKLSQGSMQMGFTAPTAGSPVTLTASATQLTGFPAAAPLTVRYSDGSIQMLAAGSAVNLSSGGATLSSVAFNGMSFDVTGTPTLGDQFTISRNQNGVSDSRNAVLLGKLQTLNTMSGGTATLTGVYAQLVASNGIQTNEAIVKGEAQTSLLVQAQDTRDSLSAVNLDEEAANLLKFQQAYQASSKAMQIASSLFDTLLQIGA